MKRSTLYLILLFLALLAALFFLLLDGDASESTSQSPKLFANPNQFEQIKDIHIENVLGEIQLKKEGSGDWEWQHREAVALPAQIDPDRVESLFNLLGGIERYRKAAMEDWNHANVTAVHIDGIPYVFSSDGKKTFLKEGNVVTELSIPGYDVDIKGFFQIDPRFWADRSLANSNWQTTKSIAIQSKDQTPILIAATERFFQVEGLTAMDSAKVYDYINQFESLKGATFLPEDLGVGLFIGEIQIADIRSENNVSLRFHKMNGRDYWAVRRDNFLPQKINPKLVDQLLIPLDSLR